MLSRLLRVAIFISFFLSAGSAFAAGGTCPNAANYVNPSNPIGPLVTLSSLGITNCFYVSKSLGSDTAAGTDESHSWAHLPGMHDCTSVCNSTSISSGEGFILRGGDHWVVADMPVTWNEGGASSHPLYIGVDPSWYAGSSWARPILDCQATECNSSNGQIEIGGSYVIVDDLELTGIYFNTSTMKGIQTTSDHTTVERCYFHGWSHNANFSGSNDDGRGFIFAANTSGGGTAGQGVVFGPFNVVDGSDTTRDMMGGSDDAETVEYNEFNWVYNCVRGVHTYVFGNMCEDIVIEGWPNADHANGISIFDTFSGTTMWVYDNVVRNTAASAVGSETMWLHSLGDATGDITYAYNNILYNNGRGIDIGDHPPASSGASFFYNNTVEGGGNHCFGNGEASPRGTLSYENNHCINVGVTCDLTGVTCVNLGANLTQTTAQADANTSPHFDQYTASEAYAYSPVASTNSTVGIGNNLATLCALNLTAMCSDIVYATENTTNHAVTVRTVNARLASGAWDIGAYKFQSSQTQPPQGAPGLQTSVR